MERKTTVKPVQGKPAKVPFVMQLEALECGAACLTMILAYYGKWVPLEKVRKDCAVSRDGSSARNILRAARNYGLEGAGYRVEPDVLKKEGLFPCIIHWDMNHFVVLRGFRGSKALLNDPARGSVTVSAEEFNTSFTGIALLFEPTEQFETGGRKKSTAEFAASRLRGSGSAFAFVALATMTASLFGVISPVFTRIFMDRILTGKNDHWIVPFLIFFSVISILQLTVAWLKAIYSFRIGAKLMVRGGSSFMWKVLRLPLEFFSQRMAGDILLRGNANAEIAGTLINTLAPLLFNTIMMAFYLVVMLRYSLVLTLVGVIAVLLDVSISQIVARRQINVTRIEMADQARMNSLAVAGIDMIETIKASGSEQGFFQKWSGYQANVQALDKDFQQKNYVLMSIPQAVMSLSLVLIRLISVWLCMQGHFTLGMLTAFQGFLASFLQPSMALIDAFKEYQVSRTEMERIEDVMEYPEDPRFQSKPEEDGEPFAKLRGKVELKNVTFGYSPLAPPLIRDFNLTLEPGKKVAFVGSSGCGKSTLAKLITNLYQPWSGEILYDGKPASSIDPDTFTASVAVVDQDITLFEDTIANNIRMWDETIEDFAMILAARDAQLHEDIMKRKGGYQYRLHEGGRDFSGGQRQRMEIARVLAQDPTIVVLDEATSALDAKTEYNVVKSICDRGITCIMVAHRLSTIRDCDEIIVLDHGTVVERGTHNELYARGGHYTELISSE